ncbi:MAG: NAD(P)-dependent alcohol dehydrogenase [Candidatus Nanopelagicales bacterium]
MRAIVQERYGSPRDVLHVREIDRPVPGTGQVLVRVRATSVHADVWHAVTGIPYIFRALGSGLRAPKRQVPGTDLAGEVVQVGSGASRLLPGDRVFGEITLPGKWFNAGALAEYAAVDETLLAPIPDGLSFIEAAAVPTAALIALMNLLDQGRVRQGQRVLVNGAAGAVGVWAVQMATAFGAHVTAVDAPTKLDLLRDLGAEQVIDYTHRDFTRMGMRFDLVFDVVSRARFSEVRRTLEPDGTYLLVGTANTADRGTGRWAVSGGCSRFWRSPRWSSNCPASDRSARVRRAGQRSWNCSGKGASAPWSTNARFPSTRPPTRSTTSPPAPRRAA